MADSSKTERATDRRRKKAREQGQMVRSRELPGVAAAAAAVAVLMLRAPAALARWNVLYRGLIDTAATSDIDRNGPVLYLSALEVLLSVAPILLAAMAASLFIGLMQGGLNIAPAALSLKFERFNPAAKLGQIFSPVGLSNLLKSLLPFGAIIWIVCSIMTTHWSAMVNASAVGLRGLGSLIGSMAWELAWKSGLVLLIWAAVDYALVWRKMESDLKMTKQELREEHKETDGNPQIKSRVRRMRARIRKAQTLKAAATATVVITNPTHYAVALRYDSEMDAPVIVAKGLDLLAQKIKQLARDNSIMLVENKPLAQALYKTVEVGESIPAKLYQAVAEVLVLVYRAQADVRRKEAEARSRDASGQRIVNTPQAAQETTL